MDYSDVPGSPPLPAPDSEVAGRLPQEQPKDEDMGFLDLNPDLEAEEDSALPTTSTEPAGLSFDFVAEEVSADAMEDDAEPVSKSASAVFDHREDFEPTIIPSPGEEVSTPGTAWTRHRRLSNAQQSKFINYLDDQLLNIRRRFVQSHGLNDDAGYTTLSELLDDLKQLLGFIWLSIEPSNVPPLSRETYSHLSSPLFGQVDYLISMANDILDYLAKLEIKDAETAVQLLKLLDSLDAKFSRLIDGTIPGAKSMSRTEAVRLMAIAERTRVTVADIFDKQGIQGFHYELSKVYERVLDRTT